MPGGEPVYRLLSMRRVNVIRQVKLPTQYQTHRYKPQIEKHTQDITVLALELTSHFPTLLFFWLSGKVAGLDLPSVTMSSNKHGR